MRKLLAVLMLGVVPGLSWACPVDINVADVKALQTLQGIGAAKAEAIVAYRTQTPFKSPEDLKKVQGIGDATFDKNRECITVAQTSR